MAQENPVIDLFGDPVLARREGPGRPEAVWSREGSNKVLLAFALDKTVKFAAGLVDLSVPTFRKVYFSECAKRKLAAAKFQFRQLALLADEAEKGNVGAIKELDRQLDKLRIQGAGERVKARGQAEPKPEKLGKKEAAKAAAKGLGGRFETRTPPPGAVN